MFGKKEVKKDKKTEKNEKHDMKSLKSINIFVVVIVAIMITSLVLVYGNRDDETIFTGINDFFRTFNKKKIVNEESNTVSIQEDAWVNYESGPNKYIGMVLGETIVMGKNDWFNQQMKYLMEDTRIDSYFKYSYAKMIFDMAVNRIIAVHNAKKNGLIISDKYKIDEVAKRYYTDKDGDTDYDAMKKNEAQVTALAEEMQNTLLFENYTNDCFNGLPLSNKEFWDNYVLGNVKLSAKYINISNNDIEFEKLSSFLSSNKNEYIKYRLTEIVFAPDKTQDAENALKEILKDITKFNEIAEQLNKDKKITAVKKEKEYTYLSDYKENEIKEMLKNKSIGGISDKIIKTETALIIFRIEDLVIPALSDKETYERVSKDYSKKNYIEIDKQNREIADKIYEYAKTNGIENAASRFGKKVEKTEPSPFLDNFPVLNTDNTSDAEYIAQIFKLPKALNAVTMPYKHESGYIISALNDKIDINMDDLIVKFDGYADRYTNNKINGLEEDYFKNEKKKHEVIDNFQYVNYEVFIK